MVEFHALHGTVRGKLLASATIIKSRMQLLPGGTKCAADFLIIFSLPALGSFLCRNTEDLTKNLCFWSLLALFSVLLTASHGGYHTVSAHQQRAQYGLTANWFLATSLAMLSLAVLLGHPNILARQWVAYDLVLTPLLLIARRVLLAPKYAAAAHSSAAPGPIIVCYDRAPHGLYRELLRNNLPSYIDGILYLSSERAASDTETWPELRDLDTLQEKLRVSRTKDIIFIHHPAFDCLEQEMSEALSKIVLTCPARIWLAFDVASSLPELLCKAAGSYRLVPIVTDELLASNNLRKRIFDLAATSVLLIAVSPLLAVCAALVLSSGPGPIIFRQLRTGAHGREFQVLKFRTMTHDPYRAFVQARQDDPRVTRAGRWLRRSSLDELPQLFNVLRGDMSLVGPRPHAPETQVEGMSFENALKLYQVRHRVKPGMTGLAQIRGLRGATPMLKHLEQRLASDLEYIQSWSIWLDLSILAQTLPALFMPTNA